MPEHDVPEPAQGSTTTRFYEKNKDRYDYRNLEHGDCDVRYFIPRSDTEGVPFYDGAIHDALTRNKDFFGVLPAHPRFSFVETTDDFNAFFPNLGKVKGDWHHARATGRRATLLTPSAMATESNKGQHYNHADLPQLFRNRLAHEVAHLSHRVLQPDRYEITPSWLKEATAMHIPSPDPVRIVPRNYTDADLHRDLLPFSTIPESEVLKSTLRNGESPILYSFARSFSDWLAGYLTPHPIPEDAHRNKESMLKQFVRHMAGSTGTFNEEFQKFVGLSQEEAFQTYMKYLSGLASVRTLRPA